MQNAGRILLMPKGDYSAGTTYTMLDLVNHGGASWVCKKDCTGQEPTDNNTTYWQRFGTAVDLSNYLQKSGGIVNGPTYIKSYFFVSKDDATSALSYVQNLMRSVYQEVNSNGGYVLYDKTNSKPIINSTVDGTNTFNGTASGNLPLSGGVVENANRRVMSVSNNSGTVASIGYRHGDTLFGEIGVNANGAFFIDPSGAVNKLLHTGNKPTGTYTGNGSTVRREIATGGIGDAIVIKGSNGTCAFVYKGAVGREGATVKSLTASEVDVNESILYLITNDACLNAEGVVYTYHVV